MFQCKNVRSLTAKWRIIIWSANKCTVPCKFSCIGLINYINFGHNCSITQLLNYPSGCLPHAYTFPPSPLRHTQLEDIPSSLVQVSSSSTPTQPTPAHSSNYLAFLPTASHSITSVFRVCLFSSGFPPSPISTFSTITKLSTIRGENTPNMSRLWCKFTNRGSNSSRIL